jgi:hypothetical protein
MMREPKTRLAADLFYAILVVAILAAGLAAGATTLDYQLSELAALLALA